MIPYKKSMSWIVIVTFFVSLFAGTGALYPKAASAYDAPPKDQGHSGPNPDPPPNPKPDDDPKQDEAGDDPVNIASGNFIHRHQDLFIPGRLPLEISRTYNCQDMCEGLFGYGWSFTYNISLIEVMKGSEHHVIIKREDGRRLQFKDNEDGTFTAPSGWYLTLTKTAGDYTLKEKNGTKYNFSGSNLVSIADRNNNQVTLNYDGSGKLSTVTGPAGRTLTFTYGTNNKIATIIDPAGRTFAYGYDSNNNLISYTDPAGNTTQYAYDSQHRLTTITDPKGTTFLANTYDSEDKITRQDYNGGTYYFNYYPSSKYTRVRNLRGYYTYHYYNDNGNPTTTRDALGNSTVRTWDANMNLTSLKDARGYTTTYTYDSMGNLLTKNDPQGNVTTFTRETTYNKITSITDALGRTTNLEYDSSGNLVKETDHLGYQTVLAYNSSGDMVSMTDPAGNSTTYVYNTYGYLSSSTDALGNSNSNTYDILGNITSVTDKNINTTLYAYDQLNRRIQITDALGNVTTVTYDENGNRTSMVNPEGKTTTFSYDNYNQLITKTDASNNTKSYAYDAMGNVLTITDAEGNTTGYAYDALSRVIKVTDALGNSSEYTYDQNGNRVSVKDANGNTTSYTYDARNYLTKTTYADGSEKIYVYDQVGNLTSQTDQKGNTTSYSYDPLNRLATKTYPDNTQTTYIYGPNPHQSFIHSVLTSGLISANYGNSNITYSYDSLNRVTRVTQGTKTLTYEYDNKGNRTKLVYPDGTYITYAYDALNRLLQIQDANGQVITNYTYDSLNRKTRLDFQNGTQALYQYDSINNLTSLANMVPATQTTISSFVYAYDKIGNRTSMITPEGVHNYTYDNIYRINGADHPETYPFPDKTYNYDAVGSRTTAVDGGAVSYTTNAMNQYTAVGGIGYSYDANGNLTGDGANIYQYDYENRLVSVATPTEVINFAYDPFGRRVSKSVNGVATNYIYDGSHVIVEEDGNTTKYVYGRSIDDVLCMIKGSTVYYYHKDALGSVTEITGSSGNVVESYRYDVYGKSEIKDGAGDVISQSATGNPYRYNGRRLDTETGLYYFRARMYSPAIGRFIQQDPVWHVTDFNLYTYARNNPLLFKDPWGMAPGDSYDTQDEAAQDAMDDIIDQSINEDREYGGWIYQNDDGTYSYTEPNRGTEHGCSPGVRPENGTAYYHTHGAESGPDYDDENFSPKDRNYADNNDVDGYVETPSGAIKRYDHDSGSVTGTELRPGKNPQP